MYISFDEYTNNRRRDESERGLEYGVSQKTNTNKHTFSLSHQYIYKNLFLRGEETISKRKRENAQKKRNNKQKWESGSLRGERVRERPACFRPDSMMIMKSQTDRYIFVCVCKCTCSGMFKCEGGE